MKYTELPLAEVAAAMRAITDEARVTFGALDEQQLNWRPDEQQWSAAQCFEHLVATNRLMFDAAKSAIEHPPTSIWQRLPLWPALLGKVMVSSQAPRQPSSRKYITEPIARPASNVSADIIDRFVNQHHELEAWTRGLDESVVRRAILISPFVRIITYSVLDGLRLIVAHDRRHFEQAQRVLQARRPAALP
jgi:hypothetical protein